MPAAPADAVTTERRRPRGGPRRVVVLGSTGSIGVNSLEVIAHLQAQGQDISVAGLAAGNNLDLLLQQVKRHQPEAVAIADEQKGQQLRDALPDGIHVFTGPDAALDLTRALDATDLIAAIVGAAGLPATLAAIDKGWRIGLANKETLVAAGALVIPRVQQSASELLPIDSEHSAIFQCLASAVGSRRSAVLDRADAATECRLTTHDCRRVVLTASGGPFRTWDKSAIADATVEQALNHPTWNMGPKITIDSASMFNKALEIIEAHWLFGLSGERVKVIIHPQSIVHSFVEFIDGSVLAQLGPPDMKTPIQYALTYPDRAPGCSTTMDWSTLSELTFEPPDPARFPAIRLAYDVMAAGQTAGAVFNAANEQAVEAFLSHRIRFGQIAELVDHALQTIGLQPADSLETILAADQKARQCVMNQVKQTT